MNSTILLIGRVLLGIIFVLAGGSKLPDIGPTAGLISGAGFPAANALGYVAAIFEILAGIAIMIGFQTRNVAWLLAAFCLFTGFAFHIGSFNIASFPDQANAMLSDLNMIMLMKNIAMAGGFMLLTQTGAGAYSVDAKLN